MMAVNKHDRGMASRNHDFGQPQRAESSVSGAGECSDFLMLQSTYGNSYLQRVLTHVNNEPFCKEHCGHKAVQLKASGCCSGCGCSSRQRDEEEARKMETVIRKSESMISKERQDSPGAGESRLASRILSRKGGGAPLDKETRSTMSSYFSHDFRQVRLHTDSFAAEAAERMNAEAFTIGHDVFFNSGRYARTARGKELLAHELTHVAQQAGKRPAINYWTKQGVLNELCPSADKWVVGKLDVSKVYSFDKIVRKWKLYDKTSTGGKGKFVKNHSYEVDGLNDTAAKEIYVRKSIADPEAASTFYHETTHQGQPATMALLEKEYDAWISEEGYRIRHGLSENAAGFRTKKGTTWVANESEIKKYVKALYQHRDPSSPYYYEWDGQDDYGVKQVKGWTCP